MTKGEQIRLTNPFVKGSSFLNMDLRFEGLSWVKGICERIEVSCNEYVDACDKYVCTAGKHLKKIYDEIGEWEKQSDFEWSGSYSSLEHAMLFKVSARPSAEHDKNLSNDNLSVNEKETVSISSVLPTLVKLSCGSDILNQGDICNKDNTESLLTAYGKRDACAGEQLLSGEVDVSLRHEATSYEVCTKSSTDDCFHENLSAYDEFLETVAASEHSIQVAFSNKPQDLSDRDACDIDEQELLSTEVTTSTCALDTEESCKEISDTITCFTSCSSSPRQDYLLLSQTHLGGGSSIVSGICTSEVATSLISSLDTEHNPPIESGKSEASAQIPEIGEPVTDNSDGKEQNISSSSDVDNAYTNMEIFKDVVLEDNWNDTETDEIVMSLNRASKKASYKKKFRNLFISKAGSQTGYNTADNMSYSVNAGYRNSVATVPVPSRDLCPKISSSEDFIESEWELV